MDVRKYPLQFFPLPYYPATEAVFPNIQATTPKPQPLPIVHYYIVYHYQEEFDSIIFVTLQKVDDYC